MLRVEKQDQTWTNVSGSNNKLSNRGVSVTEDLYQPLSPHDVPRIYIYSRPQLTDCISNKAFYLQYLLPASTRRVGTSQKGMEYWSTHISTIST